jgi:hypothetical protein
LRTIIQIFGRVVIFEMDAMYQTAFGIGKSVRHWRLHLEQTTPPQHTLTGSLISSRVMIPYYYALCILPICWHYFKHLYSKNTVSLEHHLFTRPFSLWSVASWMPMIFRVHAVSGLQALRQRQWMTWSRLLLGAPSPQTQLTHPCDRSIIIMYSCDLILEWLNVGHANCECRIRTVAYVEAWISVGCHTYTSKSYDVYV